MKVCPILILLLASASVKLSLALGLSLARCQDNSHCGSSLSCTDLSDVLLFRSCSSDSEYCVCTPDTPTDVICSPQIACREGEMCIQVPPTALQFFQDQFSSLDLSLCVDLTQSQFLLNFKTCDDDSVCEADGMCAKNSRTGVCFCASSLLRNNSMKLEPNQSEDSTASSSTSATSPPSIELFAEPSGSTATPDAEEQSQVQSANVCIASSLLREMHPEQLLYAKHYLAEVLCDRHESCATGGHMVLYKDQSMMMSSYCLKVGCRTRLTYVNSPKYKRSLRIQSNTHALMFLAFAARYGSKAEEQVLALAVRMGL